MESWWQRYPDAYKAEKAALDAFGCAWTRDEVAWQLGRLVIHIDIQQHEGTALKLIADYPDTFPYFQPMVSLPEQVLGRHQHPVGKNLCLLVYIRIDLAPNSHDHLATLSHNKVAGTSHFKTATHSHPKPATTSSTAAAGSCRT